MTKRLIEEGCNMYICEKEFEDTVVHMAVKLGRLRVLSLFTEYNFNWNQKNKAGETAFYIASGLADVSALKILSTVSQVNQELGDESGKTPILNAEEKSPNAFEFLRDLELEKLRMIALFDIQNFRKM